MPTLFDLPYEIRSQIYEYVLFKVKLKTASPLLGWDAATNKVVVQDKTKFELLVETTRQVGTQKDLASVEVLRPRSPLAIWHATRGFRTDQCLIDVIARKASFYVSSYGHLEALGRNPILKALRKLDPTADLRVCLGSVHRLKGDNDPKLEMFSKVFSTLKKVSLTTLMAAHMFSAPKKSRTMFDDRETLIEMHRGCTFGSDWRVHTSLPTVSQSLGAELMQHIPYHSWILEELSACSKTCNFRIMIEFDVYLWKSAFDGILPCTALSTSKYERIGLYLAELDIETLILDIRPAAKRSTLYSSTVYTVLPNRPEGTLGQTMWIKMERNGQV